MSDATRPAEPLSSGSYERRLTEGAARAGRASPVRRALLPHGPPVWVVVGGEEARVALADDRLGSDHDRLAEILRRLRAEQTVGTQYAQRADEYLMACECTLLMADPPQHERLRRVIERAFTAERVEALRQYAETVADELLDSLGAASGTADAGSDTGSDTAADAVPGTASDAGSDTGAPADLVAQYASPLSALVLARLLGVPRGHVPSFRAWLAALPSETPVIAAAARRDLAVYVNALLDRKRAAPGDDLLSALVAASWDGELARADLLPSALLLVTAAHELSTDFLGVAALAVMTTPGLAESLRTGPPDDCAALAEVLLRREGPALAAPRFTRVPIVVGRVEIPAGELVLVALAAADRVERGLVSTSGIDHDRSGAAGPSPDPSPSPSHGAHHCLGASLALLEGAVALRALVRRFPAARPAVAADRIEHRRAPLANGLAALPALLT